MGCIGGKEWHCLHEERDISLKRHLELYVLEKIFLVPRCGPFHRVVSCKLSSMLLSAWVAIVYGLGLNAIVMLKTRSLIRNIEFSLPENIKRNASIGNATI